MQKNNSSNEKILIIGAGPAGIFCANELANAGKKAEILEKESSVGGTAKTLEFKEGNLVFRTDLGPHRFFSKNQYLYKVVGDLLKDDWMSVPRKTRQFIDGKFYDYPINALQAFKNLGVLKSSWIAGSFLVGVTKYNLFKRDISNFEDYVIANFGRALGEINMLNYTEKIWGIPCKQIHPDWGKQRIKGLNLMSALKNAFFKSKKDEPKTLVDEFYYPRYGTGTIYESIARKVSAKGHKINFNSYPTRITHDGKKILSVEANIHGKKKTFKPGVLVESIPITSLLELLSPLPPREVLDAAKKLRWRSQVYLFITLDKQSVTKDNWIYFPDRKIPFGRIAEMKNFSSAMSPEGKTSLFVEFFVFDNDKIWNLSEDELFNLASKYLQNLGFFKRKEVLGFHLIKQKNVYPVYDLNYEKNLSVIKNYLNNFSNLFYIGRPGRFKYNNQDHSMEMGIIAARSIIDGKKYDIESVGSEKAYFESGHLATPSNKEKVSYNWMILEDRGGENGEGNGNSKQ